MNSITAHSFMDYGFQHKGRLTKNAKIANNTWFQTGGCAEYLFKPKCTEDLENFLTQKPNGLNHTVIGVGSNILIRDGGISGVTIRLLKDFSEISICKDDLGISINAGAAALDSNVSKIASSKGLEGLEFLSGVPGTIGGALRMNAGAFGREMSDVVISATAISSDGTKKYLTNSEMGFSYRKCSIPEDWIFIETSLRVINGDPILIKKRMTEIANYRDQSQPIRTRTGGSTFKNPAGAKAWKLIEEAGCRGLQVGDAEISKKHCNFIINKKNATASDIENLGEEVRSRVEKNSGIKLEWEIKRIGSRTRSFGEVNIK
ncbi:MAG: UDP-N-acetylenolpyruvoylglucosamine reductase [Alphaproteobacteria bacterium]|nr:UDP-N-acetylenolpyruvoylglucosamine reductase [Alphaproteobacteria bacterium]|tara:strand:- start:3432 stop:4385 length:954 start_codon:yes stop_codon:yes gene_type:complete